MNLDNFIDAVYVINLPQSTKRLKRFQQNYKNFNHPNLIQFSAIDGKDVKINNWPGNLGSFFENVSDEWDMIYLYAECHTIEPDLLSDKTMKLNNTLGTVGILYNQKCLNIVFNKIENDLRWIDSSIADLHTKLNVYAAPKSIVNH